ncbi:MAG: autotransporter outer membrane beta-barrel domain-containing protein, partial [Pseudomonadales bacterium]|nr:autotransporter outer membrane beta-barrel domain-containing protein [Pseudomonadales bacterium]
LEPRMPSLANRLFSCVTRNTYGSLRDVCDQAINHLQNGNLSGLASLMEALEPIAPGIAADVSQYRLGAINTSLQQRLFRLRSSNEVAQIESKTQYLVNQQWLMAGDKLAQAEAGGGDIANDASPNELTVDQSINEYGKLGFFVDVSLSDAERDTAGLESDTSLTVMTLGIDYRFTDRFIGGLAFNIGQSATDIDSSVSGEMDTTNYSFVFYSTYYLQDWYFDAVLLLGGTEYDQTRSPELFNNDYIATYHGNEQVLSLAGGYNFNFSHFNINPYAQYNMGQVSIDGYRERAANPDGPNAENTLEIDKQSLDVASLNVGSYFRYIMSTKHGVLIPHISLALIQDFETDASVISGRFVASPSSGSDFELSTPEGDSSYMVLGAGFSFQMKNGNAGFINLESIQGYEDLTQLRFTAGWRWEI